MKKTLSLLSLLVAAWLLLGATPARAQDPAPARNVAKNFYGWYIKHSEKMWDQLNQVKPLFEADLYKRLQAWYKSGKVDFDPFCNAQMLPKSYTLGAVKFERDFALIPVTCTMSRGGQTKLTLVLHRAVDHYEIWNFLYSKDFDLRSFLEKNG